MSEVIFRPEVKLQEVTKLRQIKKGDNLIFTDYSGEVFSKTVKLVKISEADGEEIIINKKKNRFFNVGLFLDGASWVKSCYVVKSDTPVRKLNQPQAQHNNRES